MVDVPRPWSHLMMVLKASRLKVSCVCRFFNFVASALLFPRLYVLCSVLHSAVKTKNTHSNPYTG